ncbi:MAG: YkgJ family cysteine cluster protein [Thermoprotei archaeon]|nr:MAG: YkgJ family cysteine cluster protein [Thermoprotei archaeon]
MRYFTWKRDYCTKCGKCCLETEMILLRSDIERIKSLGYDESFFVREIYGYKVLKNANGHCVFYNPLTKKCRIYPARPIGCRLYPIIYDEERGVTVDSYCPLANTVTKDELRRASRIIDKIVDELSRS